MSVKRHAEVARRRGRGRRARRAAARMDRALWDYKRARMALQKGMQTDGESDVGFKPGLEAGPPPPMTSLNKAGFEQLREVGMSVTQARRVIRYRDEHGGFAQLDDLDAVPGLPSDLRSRVKRDTTL